MEVDPDCTFTVNPELFNILKKLNMIVVRCPRCNSDIVGLVKHKNSNMILQQIYARCNHCDQDIVMLLVNSKELNT
jgi:uncharacterized protein with PIN domain